MGQLLRKDGGWNKACRGLQNDRAEILTWIRLDFTSPPEKQHFFLTTVSDLEYLFPGSGWAQESFSRFRCPGAIFICWLQYNVSLCLFFLHRAAARCNKGIEVLLAVALEHFVLVVVRVLRGPSLADDSAKKIRYLIHCQWCEERIFQKEGNMVEGKWLFFCAF